MKNMTLLGVTGSGKTFTMANVIQELQRPTLIMAPNKTLAAQLYGDFRAYFPENAVEYFVSYYDYYQPEAYVPSSDTYIEKDASINAHIEQMRLSATKALLERRDTIIVASVSAIYGLGDPQSYLRMVLHLDRGDRVDQRYIVQRLAELQYTRNDMAFQRGTYRVRGDVVDIFPAESEKEAVRVELFDDEIENISLFDPLTGEVIRASKTTAVRYERDRPGELVHVDVKKIGRIPPGGGWRARGRQATNPGKKQRRVGYDYVADMLQSKRYRLYDPEMNGGLWVGKEYGKSAAYQRDPLYNLSHGATAMQVARFYYLLETGRVVGKRLSVVMKSMLGDPGIDHKFVKGLRDYPDVEIYRKSGSWRRWHGDSAIIEAAGLKYIVVALAEDARGGEWLSRMIKPIHELMLAQHPGSGRR